MKRNLLIGTSLVAAAVASTSLDARSFSVMTEEARTDNTELNAAIHVVTVGHAKTTGKTALKAGESSAFADAYKAAEAYVLAEHTKLAKDGKVAPVTFAEVAKALATDKALLALVKGHRELVVAQVEADAEKVAEAKTINEDNKTDAKVDVKSDPNANQTVVPVVSADATEEATFEDLEDAAKETIESYESALADANETKINALDAADVVTAATAAKEKTAEALESAKEKATKAATQLETYRKALKTLQDEKAELEETDLTKKSDAEKDKISADKAVVEEKIENAEKKIKTAEANKKAADDAVKAAKSADERAADRLTSAQAKKEKADINAKKATEAFEKAKTDAQAALKSLLAVAEKTKADADAEATRTKEIAKSLRTQVVALKAAKEAAEGKKAELEAEFEELNAGLEQLKQAAAKENASDAEKEAVKKFEDDFMARVPEFAQAELNVERAKSAFEIAEEAKTKADADAKKAEDEKTKAKKDLKVAKERSDSFDVLVEQSKIISSEKAKIDAGERAVEVAKQKVAAANELFSNLDDEKTELESDVKFLDDEDGSSSSSGQSKKFKELSDDEKAAKKLEVEARLAEIGDELKTAKSEKEKAEAALEKLKITTNNKKAISERKIEDAEGKIEDAEAKIEAAGKDEVQHQLRSSGGFSWTQAENRSGLGENYHHQYYEPSHMMSANGGAHSQGAGVHFDDEQSKIRKTGRGAGDQNTGSHSRTKGW